MTDRLKLFISKPINVYVGGCVIIAASSPKEALRIARINTWYRYYEDAPYNCSDSRLAEENARAEMSSFKEMEKTFYEGQARMLVDSVILH